VELRDSSGVITNRPFADLLGNFETSDFFLDLQRIPFAVKFNWPWINALTLPISILAGFYVYPSKCDIEFADRHVSDFIWYRGMRVPGKKEEEIEWQEVGRGFGFLVRHEDIGYHLKVTATPKSADGKKVGPMTEAMGKNAVQAGPGSCPFETRHLFTMDRLEGRKLRVASYNLLADYYADSEDGRTKLFCYCPEYAIKIDYRKQLLLKEIIGYNADIFCMQEVDFKVFDGDMIPFLGEQNMAGVHNKKGTTPEGVATFYRTDRFELVEHHAMNLGETVKTHPACQELWGKLQGNEKLVERFTDLGTTLQIVVLRSKEFPEKLFTVANTHLYFHPDADHIRLLQFGVSTLVIQDLMAKLKSADNSLIFCGDFNSTPECGIYKLMTEGFVPEDFIDWRSNEEQAVKNVSLSQPMKMQSACGVPKFTNYTVGFQECIDYIFHQSDKLKVVKVVEMPEEEELSAHIAIPSVVFPSDHIAIVAELEIC
jgi:2',5'-phosphodiesterase